MNTSSVLWVLVLFFGCTIVFAEIHRLTQHSSTGVVVGAQLGSLALIVGVLIVAVRWFGRRG